MTMKKKYIEVETLKCHMRLTPEDWFTPDERWLPERDIGFLIDSCPVSYFIDNEKEIDYNDCVDALLKMWMDNVITEKEYDTIIFKLIRYESKKRSNASEEAQKKLFIAERKANNNETL